MRFYRMPILFSSAVALMTEGCVTASIGVGAKNYPKISTIRTAIEQSRAIAPESKTISSSNATQIGFDLNYVSLAIDQYPGPSDNDQFGAFSAGVLLLGPTTREAAKGAKNRQQLYLTGLFGKNVLNSPEGEATEIHFEERAAGIEYRYRVLDYFKDDGPTVFVASAFLSGMYREIYVDAQEFYGAQLLLGLRVIFARYCPSTSICL